MQDIFYILAYISHRLQLHGHSIWPWYAYKAAIVWKSKSFLSCKKFNSEHQFQKGWRVNCSSRASRIRLSFTRREINSNPKKQTGTAYSMWKLFRPLSNFPNLVKMDSTHFLPYKSGCNSPQCQTKGRLWKYIVNSSREILTEAQSVARPFTNKIFIEGWSAIKHLKWTIWPHFPTTWNQALSLTSLV